MSLIVLCAGGHARVVIEALLSRGIRPVGVTDRDPARVGEAIGAVKITGSDDDVMNMAADEVELANGLGNRATRTDSGLAGRRVLFERFTALGYKFPVIAHASAVIASDAQLGDGAQVMAGAVIQPAARIGRNVLVNTRAVVEHDCIVGDHAHVAPGAVLCGGVSIGESVHVGAGAVVLVGVKVGAGAVVAAGAVVTRDVAAGGFAGNE
ncbi:NeuD/PglB/VioB family sugar acetyltransferase [Bradyrhizobium sp. NBAIM03]|uniref:NeuD/PglB/VioB family sugar acetyltransferase n=1 Tax=Bradyrhizobium sp. NBAIM03 TaxID=2793816 RepID=UPI001CD5BB14|nr:NeuD/PglB/VioB family sugar acetyltransferase [Bradyrhizobium sp. NBAIM03]MCA1532166.1 NeuD/PglB/VioB family sugar acetyltransferase [Bradyrhizobium sp. NBAIM03]